MSLVLLVATAIVRVATSARAAHDARLTDQWTPFFLGIAADPPGPVARRDERAVLSLWNRIRAALRGPAAAPLVARARDAGLHHVAMRLLSSRRADDRLNAVAAVGTLGLPSSFPGLERLARKGSSITLRSEASRSLLRLDDMRGMPIVLELLSTQGDWHPALIASVLDEANPHKASTGLAETAAAAAARGDVDVAVRLLRALIAVTSNMCLPTVRTLLADTDDADVQSACLLVIGHFADRRDHNTVRPYLRSETWFVRVHAVAALGAIGTPDDEAAVTAMLSDPEWWVRQRAAEALVRIGGLSPDELAVVFESHPEVARFAGTPYSPLAEVHL